jgi:uncharacterized lipoprotein NlpE involved in copper resistance
MSKKWMGLCSMAVVFMLVAVGGCSKKKAEEAAETEAVEEVATDVAEAVGMQAVGSYMAQLPAADTPGRMIMLSLNGDNTASMSVDFMNNQPLVVENGSWAWNETANAVDLTLNRDVSGTMVSSMMTFALAGDTLSLSNPADAGYGDMGLKLVRQAAGEEHAH